MAGRSAAVAAINAGFFLPTGEPAGLLQDRRRAGERHPVAPRSGGAVARPFRARASPAVRPGARARRDRRRPRQSAAHAARRTAWTRTARPRRAGAVHAALLDRHADAVRRRHRVRRGRPAADGRRSARSALHVGDPAAAARCWPPARRSRAKTIAGITPGMPVRTRVVYETLNGTKPADWDAAPDVVGGVGLLAKNGRMLTDWEPEKARAGFTTERHPRTVIGTAGDGRIWLITVDGRNKALSLRHELRRAAGARSPRGSRRRAEPRRRRLDDDGGAGSGGQPSVGRRRGRGRSATPSSSGEKRRTATRRTANCDLATATTEELTR